MEITSYSGDQAAELEQNYKTLKSRVDNAISESNKAPDNRLAKDILIMAQSAFKEFKLKKEDREVLYQRLQEAFEKINHKISAERSAFEREAISNYSELKLQVEEAIYQAGKAPDSRTAKSYLIEAQNAFKGLRMVKEQREELFQKLQEAFGIVNARQQAEMLEITAESQLHFFRLKPLIEEILKNTTPGNGQRELRERLIDLQAEIRQVNLLREQRDTLLQLIQQAFDAMSQARQREDELLRSEAASSFPEYTERVAQLLEAARHSSGFKEVREQLKSLQADLRESRLLYDQKDKLYADLQEAFSILNHRQDEDRKVFEVEAIANYERLKKMVNRGLQQAQESTEYKETREYLKKIQAEFKGIRMAKEQREELYTRLQTAFETLNIRLDVYFREKQKNWEVRMSFKLKDLIVNAEEMENDIRHQEETLSALQDQLDIVLQKPHEVSARIGIEARIQSAQKAIAELTVRKAETENEIESLRQRLYGNEEEVQ